MVSILVSAVFARRDIFQPFGFLLTAIVLTGCQGAQESPSSSQTWESSVRDFSFSYPDTWSLVTPSQDTEAQLLVGVLEPESGMSMVVTIRDDVPKTMLTDEDYLSAVKKQMVDHAGGNELIAEGEATFFDRPFNLLEFSMLNPKYRAEFRQMLVVRRTGKQCITFQLNFPSGVVDDGVPADLQSIIDSVRLPLE